MMASQNKFSVRLEDDAQGNTRLSLGTKFPAVYVEKGKDIFKETAKGLMKVTLEEQVSKPWIRQNFEYEHESQDRERAFQRRKALAIGLQSSHIPSYERKAFNRAKGSYGWSNTRGWN